MVAVAEDSEGIFPHRRLEWETGPGFLVVDLFRFVGKPRREVSLRRVDCEMVSLLLLLLLLLSITCKVFRNPETRGSPSTRTVPKKRYNRWMDVRTDGTRTGKFNLRLRTHNKECNYSRLSFT